ncbi:hypothetical protein H0B56_15895 [Haloechinothrix sp. YIM 98757]|uniref:CHRD domain-containing protein n=1 Tax=Haloechinothrix aidingensis TaxID=2752311 RepID=A0A838ACT6_9PSEU|nr:hypothetical protein [Haloechinothrix aidingensis]
MNDSGGSGQASLQFDGDQATVTVSYSGLAEEFQDGPFPHAQHIHIAGQGECPDASFDENGDGVVSTPEGQPAYGEVGTALTTEGETGADSALAVERFPGGPSADYERTFELNQDSADSVRHGTGVIVVHGLDPSTLSDEAAEADSPLDDSLPLAATAPALCGALSTSQMEATPEGGVDTGGGSTAGIENEWLIGLGGLTLVGAAGAGALAMRRRESGEQN